MNADLEKFLELAYTGTVRWRYSPIAVMTARELAHPHDLLARYFLVDPELTADLLTYYIDSEVVSLLDLEQLRCESPVNVDKNLIEVIGDLRFSTVFKRTERQSNVFVFLEHQSTVDDLICLRVLDYIIKSYWEYIDTLKQAEKGCPKSLPCPIAVILYHGKKPWKMLKRMRDLIDSVPGFPKDLLDFPIFLIDLPRIPPEQLKGHPALVALLETLQLGSVGKLEAGFDRVAGRLTAVRNDPRAPGWMKALVKYTISLCRIGQEAIYNAYHKILNEREARKMAMSTAQELRLEGEAKGKAEGKKEAILDCLSARFGKVPKTIRDTVNSYSDLIALKSLVGFAGTCESLDDFADGLR